MRINLKTREDIDENFLQRIMYTDAYGYVSELINYLLRVYWVYVMENVANK